MKVRFTAPAKQDLIAIQDYIARDDEAAAYRVAQRIRAQVGRLAQHPQLGRPGHIAGTRELSITGTPYFVVCRIERRSIDVLTIVHARRRWP
ncbi:MAG: addiction module toxin, RelE/StbE family [Geminicoccaceae bacterium]|jgi:toxin ParE1/3/4|nr:addiction module toxin, RelE/StbE family [Geminicoccaceae bacterium]